MVAVPVIHRSAITGCGPGRGCPDCPVRAAVGNGGLDGPAPGLTIRHPAHSSRWKLSVRFSSRDVPTHAPLKKNVMLPIAASQPAPVYRSVLPLKDLSDALAGHRNAADQFTGWHLVKIVEAQGLETGPWPIGTGMVSRVIASNKSRRRIARDAPRSAQYGYRKGRQAGRRLVAAAHLPRYLT